MLEMLEMNDKEAAVRPFVSLLGAFRSGNIGHRKLEREAVDCHLAELSECWEQRFPGFPAPRSPYASFRGARQRGTRDSYLRTVIISLLAREEQDFAEKIVVNPACVFGRHARHLASRLKSFRVVGTDINPALDRLFRYLMFGRNPENYEFRKDDIFRPELEVKPAAVVFFGACGSVSDAAIDYAINSRASYLMCRTCCHDNIGGNTTIERRFTALNWFFRLKNRYYSKIREKRTGAYFSDRYSREQYPRSEAARELSSSDEFMKISQHSVDSDICRAIIDLDRCLRLAERGYRVWHRGELFVAELNA